MEKTGNLCHSISKETKALLQRDGLVTINLHGQTLDQLGGGLSDVTVRTYGAGNEQWRSTLRALDCEAAFDPTLRFLHRTMGVPFYYTPTEDQERMFNTAKLQLEARYPNLMLVPAGPIDILRMDQIMQYVGQELIPIDGRTIRTFVPARQIPSSLYSETPYDKYFIEDNAVRSKYIAGADFFPFQLRLQGGHLLVGPNRYMEQPIGSHGILPLLIPKT